MNKCKYFHFSVNLLNQLIHTCTYMFHVCCFVNLEEVGRLAGTKTDPCLKC